MFLKNQELLLQTPGIRPEKVYYVEKVSDTESNVTKQDKSVHKVKTELLKNIMLFMR